jgi:hypothetical protein
LSTDTAAPPRPTGQLHADLINVVASLFWEPLPGERKLADLSPIEVRDAVVNRLWPWLVPYETVEIPDETHLRVRNGRCPTGHR